MTIEVQLQLFLQETHIQFAVLDKLHRLFSQSPKNISELEEAITVVHSWARLINNVVAFKDIAVID